MQLREKLLSKYESVKVKNVDIPDLDLKGYYKKKQKISQWYNIA